MSPTPTRRRPSMEAQTNRASLLESPLLTKTRTSVSPHVRRSCSVQVPPGGGTPGARLAVMPRFGSRTPASPSASSRLACMTPVRPTGTPPVVYSASKKGGSVQIPPSGGATRVLSPQSRVELLSPQSRLRAKREASPQVLPCGSGASLTLASPGVAPPASTSSPVPGLVTRLRSSPLMQDLKSPRLSVPVSFAWQGPCATPPQVLPQPMPGSLKPGEAPRLARRA